MSVSALIFRELKNSKIEDILKQHFLYFFPPESKELCTFLDLNSNVSSTAADVELRFDV